MKIGLRKPSFRKRIAARISIKRRVRHSLGLKAPRGWGWVTNPKRTAYNRIYQRTTFGIEDLKRARSLRKTTSGSQVGLGLFLLGILLLLFTLR